MLVWEENGRRIASFNISAENDCPTGWSKSSLNNVSFCRSNDGKRGIGCYSTTFSTNNVSYLTVCGRARGYQKGKTDAFLAGGNIDDSYVDGLSITHGIHVNIYGHMQLETLSMSVTPLVDVPVLHHQEVLLHLLLALTTTVNLEQKIPRMYLHTTCLTHYGMEMVVL